MDILWIIITAVVIVGTVFIIIGTRSSDNSSDKSLKAKGIFSTCKNNFDCGMGFVCELRTHPTVGVCVIAPGGACHSNGGRNDVCYSGYYCDSQDGTCLQK